MPEKTRAIRLNLWNRPDPGKVRDYLRLAALAADAARLAARHIRAQQPPSSPSAWERKGARDFVTDVDRAAESAIAEFLLDAEPTSRVWGEELSPEMTSASDAAGAPVEPGDGLSASSPGAAGRGLVWIVDPLDGTTNYLHGYPQYAVAIAALLDGQLAAGVVLDVARDQLYSATAGGGAWCGERRLAVSPITDPRLALIGTGFPFRTPHLVPRYLRQFCAIHATASGIRRAGSAALDLADVAQGRFEGFWELDLAAWDVAAGVLLVREAGGVVSDLDGSPAVVCRGAKVAGNPAIHRWLLQTLTL